MPRALAIQATNFRFWAAAMVALFLSSSRARCLLWLLGNLRLATIPLMSRFREYVYTNNALPRWLAVFDLQWKVIETQRLEPGADLAAAMRVSSG